MGMVGATGIEPVTPSMSTRRSPAELRVPSPDTMSQLARSGLAGRLVGKRDGLKILDLRVVAVACANPVPPGAGIEGFGVGLGFPHIDATADAAFLPADKLLPEEAFGLQEIGSDFRKMFAAFLKTNRWRQVIENNGGDHRPSFLILFPLLSGGPHAAIGFAHPPSP